MKKILVLIAEYDPDISANTNCLKKVLFSIMADYNITFDVLTITGNPGVAKEEHIAGINVFRVWSKHLNHVQERNQYKNHALHFTAIRLIHKIMYKCLWPSMLIYSVNDMYRESKKLMEKYKYSAIISSSGDFSIQLVAHRLFKSGSFNAAWIPIIYDPLPSNHPWFNWFVRWIMNTSKVEKEIYKKATIALVEEHQINRKLFLNNSRVIPVGIPNVISYDDINIEADCCDAKKEIRIYYAGVWRNNLRSPNYFLSVFYEFHKKYSSKVIVFTQNSDHPAFDEIQFEPYIPHEKLIVELKKADFLLNLGNNRDMVPSKIYEYIGLRKPIINVVKSKSDVTVEVIEKYGFGVNLFESDSVTESLNKLIIFTKKHHDVITMEAIRTKFFRNTPEYAAQFVIQAIL